jgi:hypothetical protein
MRTAWQTSDHPISDVFQRIPERSNILFESRFSNHMKMDHAEVHYNQIREELRNLCEEETAWWSRPKETMPPLRFEYNPKRALETAHQFRPRTISERMSKNAKHDLDDITPVSPQDIADDVDASFFDEVCGSTVMKSASTGASSADTACDSSTRDEAGAVSC